MRKFIINKSGNILILFITYIAGGNAALYAALNGVPLLSWMIAGALFCLFVIGFNDILEKVKK